MILQPQPGTGRRFSLLSSRPRVSPLPENLSPPTPLQQDDSYSSVTTDKMTKITKEALDHVNRHHSLVLRDKSGHPIKTWGEGLDSSVWDTAIAIISEIELGKTTDPEFYAGLTRFLLQRQLPDGGWPNSPGSTSGDLSATLLGYVACVRLLESSYLPSSSLRTEINLALRHSKEFLDSQKGSSRKNMGISLAFSLLNELGEFMVMADKPAIKQLLALMTPHAKPLRKVRGILSALQHAIKPAGSHALPPGLTTQAHMISQMLYVLSFPEAYPSLAIPRSLEIFLPGAEKLFSGMEHKGLYEVAAYLFASAILITADKKFLEKSAWAKNLARHLARFQGEEDKLWSYALPITYLALVSLNRTLGGDPAVSQQITESLEKLHTHHMRKSPTETQAYTFNSFTWNSVLYLEARILTDPSFVDTPEFSQGLDYLFGCQVKNGQFVFSYGAHANEAENDTSGFILRFFGDLRTLILDQPNLIPNSAKRHDILAKLDRSIDKGIRRLLHLQNNNGGWSAYNRTNLDKPPGTQPFSKGSRLFGENRMMAEDVSVADVTGHVLAALGACGYTIHNSAHVRKAVAWARRDFLSGAGWWGRWGSGYIYGSHAIVEGMQYAGMDTANDPQCQEIVSLLLNRQNPDGGWGETGKDSDDPTRDATLHAMRGPTSSILTTIALRTLLKAGISPEHPAIQNGARYLLTAYKSPEGHDFSKLTLAEKDGLLWDNPTGSASFLPTVWYIKELGFDDLGPACFLADYSRQLKILRQQQISGLHQRLPAELVEGLFENRSF